MAEIPDAHCYVVSTSTHTPDLRVSDGKIVVLVVPCKSLKEANRVMAHAKNRKDQKNVKLVFNFPKYHPGVAHYVDAKWVRASEL